MEITKESNSSEDGQEKFRKFGELIKKLFCSKYHLASSEGDRTGQSHVAWFQRGLCFFHTMVYDTFVWDTQLTESVFVKKILFV